MRYSCVALHWTSSSLLSTCVSAGANELTHTYWSQVKPNSARPLPSLQEGQGICHSWLFFHVSLHSLLFVLLPVAVPQSDRLKQSPQVWAWHLCCVSTLYTKHTLCLWLTEQHISLIFAHTALTRCGAYFCPNNSTEVQGVQLQMYGNTHWNVYLVNVSKLRLLGSKTLLWLSVVYSIYLYLYQSEVGCFWAESKAVALFCVATYYTKTYS